MRTLSPSRPVTADHHYYGLFRPCASHWYSASRIRRLCLSLLIETTGSKVPCLSPIHARAASKPQVMPVPSRSWPTRVPERTSKPRFRPGLDLFRLFISGSLAFAFMDLI